MGVRDDSGGLVDHRLQNITSLEPHALKLQPCGIRAGDFQRILGKIHSINLSGLQLVGQRQRDAS